jgi:hypothetical protein
MTVICVEGIASQRGQDFDVGNFKQRARQAGSTPLL